MWSPTHEAIMLALVGADGLSRMRLAMLLDESTPYDSRADVFLHLYHERFRDRPIGRG
jgi:hypothetical protein